LTLQLFTQTTQPWRKKVCGEGIGGCTRDQVGESALPLMGRGRTGEKQKNGKGGSSFKFEASRNYAGDGLERLTGGPQRERS